MKIKNKKWNLKSSVYQLFEINLKMYSECGSAKLFRHSKDEERRRNSIKNEKRVKVKVLMKIEIKIEVRGTVCVCVCV